MALRPYSEPCGPRRTSICSTTSNVCWFWYCDTSGTPSTTIATDGSWKRCMVTPRMLTKTVPGCCVCWTEKFVTTLLREATSVSPRSDKVRWSRTAIDVATSESLSVTFRAVTMISSLSSDAARSEEHTSELQSLMRISYAVFC